MSYGDIVRAFWDGDYDALMADEAMCPYRDHALAAAWELGFHGFPEEDLANIGVEDEPETASILQDVLTDAGCWSKICDVPGCGQVIEVPVSVHDDRELEVDANWLRLALLEHSMADPETHPQVAEVSVYED